MGQWEKVTADLKKSWDADQSVACPFTFSKNWHIGTEIILNHVFHIQNGFINLWKKLFVTLNWKVAVFFIHCSQQLYWMFLVCANDATWATNKLYTLQKSRVSHLGKIFTKGSLQINGLSKEKCCMSNKQLSLPKKGLITRGDKESIIWRKEGYPCRVCPRRKV